MRIYRHIKWAVAIRPAVTCIKFKKKWGTFLMHQLMDFGVDRGLILMQKSLIRLLHRIVPLLCLHCTDGLKGRSVESMAEDQGSRFEFLCTFGIFYLWRNEQVHSYCVQASSLFTILEKIHALLQCCSLVTVFLEFFTTMFCNRLSEGSTLPWWLPSQP